METTYEEAVLQPSERPELGSEPTSAGPLVQPTRRHHLSLRSIAVTLIAAVLASVGMLAVNPAMAAAENGLGADAPKLVDSSCTYTSGFPSFPDQRYYTLFMTYDSTHGGWSSSGWWYTSMATGSLEYNERSGWQRSDGTFRPPPSDSTVWIWAWTYTPEEGYVGHQLDRCYQGRTYTGW